MVVVGCKEVEIEILIVWIRYGGEFGNVIVVDLVDRI